MHVSQTTTISLSLPLSPLLIHQLSRTGRPGADWRKNISLNPIPNPQQALKHMHSGGPKAACWRSCSEGYYSLSSQQQQQQQQRGAGAQQKQKKAPATSALLRALCALESRVTWPMLPCCLRFLQRTYGGEVFLSQLVLTRCRCVEENVFPVALCLS